MRWGRAVALISFLRPRRDHEIVEREKHLRRIARCYNLRIFRCRGRNSNESAFGTYAVADSVRNTLLLVDPESGYGITLDEIECFLEELTAIQQWQKSRVAAAN
jgi:hypothetical protein